MSQLSQRAKLIEEEKSFRSGEALETLQHAAADSLREDADFRRRLSPKAIEASSIVSKLRSQEKETTWTQALEDRLAQRNHNLTHGAASSLDGDTIRKTNLWKIAKKFPKGALLHSHLAAMVDIRWLLEIALAIEGMCVCASQSMDTAEAREAGNIIFRFSKSNTEEYRRRKSSYTLWTASYVAQDLVPVDFAASTFPDGGIQGFVAWMRGKYTINQDCEENRRLGPHTLSQKFGRCFQTIDSLLFYEPILRLSIQRIVRALIQDRIMYAEFRVVFVTKFHGVGNDVPDEDFFNFLRVFKEELEKFKSANYQFCGARLIWTVRRKSPPQKLVTGMKDCISMKKVFPDLIAGFDLAGQETMGRSLNSMTLSLIWFQEECSNKGLAIPFLFHAGECLGDGDEADQNLFDAILLGTRRIGHAFSLIKHPLLLQKVKDNRVLVESCPISNQALRLTSSIQSHPLPAMLANGVPVALGNDDPSIFGNRDVGLTEEFYQVLYSFENVGLGGLGHLAENSIRWSCFEDQALHVWQADIDGKCMQSLKALRLQLWKDDFEAFCAWIVDTFKDANRVVENISAVGT